MIELSESVGRAMWLRKGATHKYIRRVPKPGGGYRYYYRATGATRAVGSDLLPGAKFKLTHEGQAGHFEVVRRAGNQVVLRHDESGGTMTVDADALGDLLKREHADVVSAAQARAKRDLEAARKHGSPKQIARLEERAKRLGVGKEPESLPVPMPDSLPSEIHQKRLNAALRRATGWTIERIAVNHATGYARVQASRVDGDRKTLITLTRGRHGGRVVERREVGVLRDSFYSGQWWDFSESLLLGGRTFEGMRSAMRGLANYINDNRAPGALGTSKPVLRALIREAGL